MDFSVDNLQVGEIRHLKLEATQRLLGDTIQIDESAWQSPSLLAGWTRAHVATHLARNADAHRRLVEGALTGVPAPTYDERTGREEIERGSERTGLELQIDLDTSTQRLAAAFDRVPDDRWDVHVNCAGASRPLRLLPLIRLNEVVMHHVDLDRGFTLDAAPAEATAWLLRWCILRTQECRIDSFRIVLPDDSTATVGGVPTRVVTGSPLALLGWLSGRGSAEEVTGAAGITLPRF